MTVEFPIFNQGVGYGIIIGVGAGFALGMSLVSWGLSRYLAEKQTVEMFMTAKHSVKTGMNVSNLCIKVSLFPSTEC
jgi:ribosomal protein L6P/L9E